MVLIRSDTYFVCYANSGLFIKQGNVIMTTSNTILSPSVVHFFHAQYAKLILRLVKAGTPIELLPTGFKLIPAGHGTFRIRYYSDSNFTYETPFGLELTFITPYLENSRKPFWRVMNVQYDAFSKEITEFLSRQSLPKHTKHTESKREELKQAVRENNAKHAKVNERVIKEATKKATTGKPAKPVEKTTPTPVPNIEHDEDGVCKAPEGVSTPKPERRIGDTIANIFTGKMGVPCTVLDDGFIIADTTHVALLEEWNNKQSGNTKGCLWKLVTQTQYDNRQPTQH